MACVRLLAAAAIIAAFATPSHADVFEVGDDGVATRIDVQRASPAAAPAARRRDSGRGAAAARAVYAPFVGAAAQRYEVSPALVDAIALTESRYRQSAISPRRAAGIMQLMPQTARSLGVDRLDARDNIRGGTAYLRLLLNRFDGDVVRTVAAYNAGPGAVERAHGVPHFAETQAYVSAVLARLAASAQ